MSVRLKELEEKAIGLKAEIRKRADAALEAGMTPEAEAAFNAVDADYRKVIAAIEIEKRASAVEKDRIARHEVNALTADLLRASGVSKEDIVTEQDRETALRGWLAAGRSRPTPAQEAAMAKCGMDARAPEIVIATGPSLSAGEMQDAWRNSTPQQRSAMLRGRVRIGAAGLLTSGASAGATLVSPGSLASQIEIAMLAYGGVRQVAETYTTDDGSPWKVPTANDTGNTGELVAEQGSIGSTVDATLGSKTFGAYKFSSKLMKYTAEMPRDSQFDLEGFLGQLAGERIGRVTNTYFTTGTGSSQPGGIVTVSAAGVTAAATGAVTYDELIQLVHSVDPAYRAGAAFMFNDATALALRLLKDAEGRYIWRQTGDNNLFSDTLLGFPIVINQDMPSMSTGTKPILFGRLSAMKIRHVNEFRLRRLVELYAATDEEGVIAFISEDGGVVNPGVAPIKRITMA